MAAHSIAGSWRTLIVSSRRGKGLEEDAGSIFLSGHESQSIFHTLLHAHSKPWTYSCHSWFQSACACTHSLTIVLSLSTIYPVSQGFLSINYVPGTGKDPRVSMQQIRLLFLLSFHPVVQLESEKKSEQQAISVFFLRTHLNWHIRA